MTTNEKKRILAAVMETAEDGARIHTIGLNRLKSPFPILRLVPQRLNQRLGNMPKYLIGICQ